MVSCGIDKFLRVIDSPLSNATVVSSWIVSGDWTRRTRGCKQAAVVSGVR